jgi:uncharacterized membrane protein
VINLISLSLLLVSTFLAALAGVYFKKSTKELVVSVKGFLQNVLFLHGVALSIAASILYVFALRLEHLSKAYPATSMTYIWAIILSHYMIGEKITLKKTIGIILILAGILLISYA